VILTIWPGALNGTKPAGGVAASVFESIALATPLLRKVPVNAAAATLPRKARREGARRSSRDIGNLRTL
jgi:hypothetical protein